MKRSDIIRTIQVQFKNMRASDAETVLDTVVEEMVNAIISYKRGRDIRKFFVDYKYLINKYLNEYEDILHHFPN